jgi:hypothetical protein
MKIEIFFTVLGIGIIVLHLFYGSELSIFAVMGEATSYLITLAIVYLIVSYLNKKRNTKILTNTPK